MSHSDQCFRRLKGGLDRVRGVLVSWAGSFIGKKRKKAWKVAPLCLFWSVWRERNRRIFESCESLDQTIQSSFLHIFWDWIRLYMGRFYITVRFCELVKPFIGCSCLFLCIHMFWFLVALYTSCILFKTNTISFYLSKKRLKAALRRFA